MNQRSPALSDFVYGFAGLGRLLDSGVPMSKLGAELESRVARDAQDASAMLDIATLCFLTLNPANFAHGLEYQRRALSLRQSYRLHVPPRATLQLLVIMAPGDMTSNMPVDCLLAGSDIAVTLLYVVQNQPLPAQLPSHDVVLVAMGESRENHALLERLSALDQLTSKPILNRPRHIMRTLRDTAATLLANAPGIEAPKAVRIHRTDLQAIARGALPISTLQGASRFPIIVRPIDSQGGKDLTRIDRAPDLAAYLSTVHVAEFFVARFVDYRSSDGQFRKLRIALIDGKPFPAHMAISDNWLVHYVSAGMDQSEDKRGDEGRFFDTFDTDFALRHRDSIAAIYERLALEYVTVDCAEASDGRLLVFEVDNAAIVHDYDDPMLFPYKRPAMRRLFDAFAAMLHARAREFATATTPR